MKNPRTHIGLASARVLAMAGMLVASASCWADQATAVPKDFREAKRILEQVIYREDSERRTIYCGCSFTKRKKVRPKDCGLDGEGLGQGSTRVWWEHSLPASWLQWNFSCYRERTASEGGRRPDGMSPRAFCGETDPVFAAAEGDMHNLWPAVGSINKARGAYAFGEVRGEDRAFGICDFEIGGRKAEPRESVRGELARSMLYMSDRYGVRLSGSNRKLLEAWHRLDPPDQWEVERNKRIRQVQGVGNPWIEALE